MCQGQSHAPAKCTFIPRSFISLETAGELGWQGQYVLLIQ
jgi:hypothetical protein